jgi:hypothetical protein
LIKAVGKCHPCLFASHGPPRFPLISCLFLDTFLYEERTRILVKKPPGHGRRRPCNPGSPGLSELFELSILCRGEPALGIFFFSRRTRLGDLDRNFFHRLAAPEPQRGKPQRRANKLLNAWAEVSNSCRKTPGVALRANHIFSANNVRGAKRPKNLRFFSGAHRSVIRKKILNSEKPLFQQPPKSGRTSKEGGE